MQRLFRTLLILLGFSSILGMAQTRVDDSVNRPADVQKFEVADFRLTQTRLPPTDGGEWQRVNLPDNWNVSHPGQGGQGWYRFEFFSTQISPGIQAIFLPRASMQATVFLNGALVDNSFGLYENGIRNWNRPVLIQFMPQRLREGRNELMIRVDAAADDMGGLSPVSLGPVEHVTSAYFWQRLIQLDIPMISQVLIALICLMTFGLWLLLDDALYGYFTLAASAYFVRALDFSFNSFSVPVPWVQMMVAALVTWFVIFITLFAMRLFRLQWPVVERSLLQLAALVILVLLVVNGGSLAATAAIALHIAALVLGLTTVMVLTPKIRSVRLVESLPLTGVGLLTIGLGVHDVLQRFGVFSTNTPRLSHLGAPLLIFTIAVILTSRYVNNSKLLSQTNRDLELLVTQKSAELVETLRAKLELQKDREVMQEREIIMREMHDGVGNFLTIALRAAAQVVPDMKQINGALKNCMLDLRLMIDSLGESDTGADTVAAVLGNLRYRMAPALQAEGIDLVWQVQEIEMPVELTPRNVLNLTRIFQEALTNVIKHAHATEVLIRTESIKLDDGYRAMITIRDNGHGDDSSSHIGQGIGNMRRRALQLGGDLQVRLGPGGSTIEFSMSSCSLRKAPEGLPSLKKAQP